MYLKRITLKNVKGRDTTVHLEPVDVISGHSRSGKTAVLLAARWLFTGSMPPPYGKTPKGQWLAASDGSAEMRVDGLMDNGTKAWRRLAKTDSFRVTAYLPDEITVPEMLADPLVFFSLTKQGRIDALFAASGAKKYPDHVVGLGEQAGVKCELRDWLYPYESAEAWVKENLDLADWEETNAVQAIAKYRLLLENPVAPVTQEELDKARDRFHKSHKAWKDTDLPIVDAVDEKSICSPEDAVEDAERWLETVSEADECPCCGIGASQGWREHAIVVAKKRLAEARKAMDENAKSQAKSRDDCKLWSQNRIELETEAILAQEAYTSLLNRSQERERYEAACGAMRKAESELLAIRKQIERLKAFKAALDSDKLALLQQASGKIVEVMNQFAEGMIGSRLEFDADMELGRRVSESDRKSGCMAPIGSWISHRSFSASEQAVAYTALTVALAAQAPFKLVLMDELGRMDDDLRNQVLGRIHALVDAGVIHQFIGAQAV